MGKPVAGPIRQLRRHPGGGSNRSWDGFPTHQEAMGKQVIQKNMGNVLGRWVADIVAICFAVLNDLFWGVPPKTENTNKE